MLSVFAQASITSCNFIDAFCKAGALAPLQSTNAYTIRVVTALATFHWPALHQDSSSFDGE